MQSNQIPTKFQIPFGNAAQPGYIRPVPQASQIGITDGAASLSDGFPPLNFLPTGAGGVPPFGQDMNGIINQISAWCRWQAGGGAPMYDSTWAQAVGGYPVGSVVAATTAGGLWLCTAENNLTNPDQGGTGWIPIIYKLLAPKVYYVNAATGSDGNNGTSSATPFATIQKAVTQIPFYNLNGFSITIYVADGAYGAVNLPIVNGSGSISVVGNLTTPANCTITGINQSAINCRNVNGQYFMAGFKLMASGSAAGGADAVCGISVVGGGTTFTMGNVDFGQCVGAHYSVSQNAVGSFAQSCTINLSGGASGNASIDGAFLSCYGSSLFQNASGGNPSITIPAAIHFGGSFVESVFSSFVQFPYASLTGATNVTGYKYFASGNGVISVSGAGVNYYPGTANPTPTSYGGQYY